VSDHHVLDHPVAASLAGTQRHLARRHGEAMTYQAGVATFAALQPGAGPGAWDDLAHLLGPAAFADLFSADAEAPGWEPVFTLEGVQMVLPPDEATQAIDAGSGRDVVRLGVDDVADMTALVELTRPGPFGPHTVELGTYLGVRDGGRLVAMAGERLRPPGWSEVSAVCTAPEARGLGLASLLVGRLAAAAAERGEGTFFHVAGVNATARELYEHLGFRVRRPVTFRGYRTPS
jgi:ribosomal protein S18 acetylase RimI-like enzyme